VRTVDGLITNADEQVDVQKRDLGRVLCQDFNIVRRQVAICRRLSNSFAALPLTASSKAGNPPQWQRLASVGGHQPKWLLDNLARVQADHQHAVVVETQQETDARRQRQQQQEEEDAKLAAQLAQE
jgi:hypothetical protein